MRRRPNGRHGASLPREAISLAILDDFRCAEPKNHPRSVIEGVDLVHLRYRVCLTLTLCHAVTQEATCSVSETSPDTAACQFACCGITTQSGCYGYRSTGYNRELYVECPDDRDAWVTELQEPVATS